MVLSRSPRSSILQRKSPTPSSSRSTIAASRRHDFFSSQSLVLLVACHALVRFDHGLVDGVVRQVQEEGLLCVPLEKLDRAFGDLADIVWIVFRVASLAGIVRN